VNWFQYFPRDWLGATLQLTCEEDGVYHRLVDWCYVNECALPHDLDECCRIARAQTRSEREAVTRVTRDYFAETPNGLSQRHIAQKVEKFLLGEPERQAKRALDAERKRRNRVTQRLLYTTLKDAGIYARGGLSMRELRELIASAGLSQPDEPVTWRDFRGNAKTGPPSSGHALSEQTAQRDRSQSHSLAENHYTSTPEVSSSEDTGRAPAGATRAGEACKAMRACGLSTTNPSDPRLHALLDAGVTNDEFAYAAAKAVASGKGDAWAYVLAVVRGQREDAAKAGPVQAARASAAAARIAEIAPGLEQWGT
jgi:uncharacterized protein YdaU (DUF1376 family)